MADKLFLRKVSGAAVPMDENMTEIYNSFKIGQIFEVLPWKDRNAAFHRKLFGMLGIISERNQKWKNRHALLKACQFGIGHVDIISDINGNLTPVPKSIKFDKMKEPEFIWLYKEISQYILTNLEMLVPNMPEQEFETYVHRILMFN